VDELNAPSIDCAVASDVAALSDASIALFLDVDGTLLDLEDWLRPLRAPNVSLPAHWRSSAVVLSMISTNSSHHCGCE
jgi:hypothetical protein